MNIPVLCTLITLAYCVCMYVCLYVVVEGLVSIIYVWGIHGNRGAL